MYVGRTKGLCRQAYAKKLNISVSSLKSQSLLIRIERTIESSRRLITAADSSRYPS